MVLGFVPRDASLLLRRDGGGDGVEVAEHGLIPVGVRIEPGPDDLRGHQHQVHHQVPVRVQIHVGQEPVVVVVQGFVQFQVDGLVLHQGRIEVGGVYPVGVGHLGGVHPDVPHPHRSPCLQAGGGRTGKAPDQYLDGVPVHHIGHHRLDRRGGIGWDGNSTDRYPNCQSGNYQSPAHAHLLFLLSLEERGRGRHSSGEG